MKLIGTFLSYAKSKGLATFLTDIKFAVNGNPFVVGFDPEDKPEHLYFTLSLSKKIQRGAKIKDFNLRKWVIWESTNSEEKAVYKIGNMESIDEYKPYEELLKDNSNLYYFEKLKAIEWRDKRKLIIERENNVCEICKQECISDLESYFANAKNQEKDYHLKWANVHHTFYIKDALPWHYPNESLRLLCSGCHQDLHSKIKITGYKDYEFNSTLALVDCLKCAGTGYLPEYYYYYNGVCFGCEGTGYVNFYNDGGMSSIFDEYLIQG